MPKGKPFSDDLRRRAIYLRNQHSLSNNATAKILQNMDGTTIAKYCIIFFL